MPSFPGSTLARADQGERAPGAPPKRQGARRQRRGTGCRAVWGGRSAQVASTEQPQALWPVYCVVCERNSAAGLQVLPGEDSCPHLHLPTRPHQTQLCKSELQGWAHFPACSGQTAHSAPLRVAVRRSQPELTRQWPRGLSQDASSRTGEPAPSPPQPGTRIIPKRQGRPAGVTALSAGMRKGLSAPSITEEIQMNWIF